METLLLIALVAWIVYLFVRRPGFETGLYVLVALLLVVALVSGLDLHGLPTPRIFR